MEIKTETSKAVRMLQLMSARLREGKALFDPIKIDINELKDGDYRASTMMMNEGKTAYVICRFKGLDVDGLDDGEGSLCVSADTLISYYEECYGSDEMLRMWNEGVWLRTVNENSEFPTEVKHPMFSEDNQSLRALDELPFKMKDGIPYYQKGTIKPDTEVTIDVAEIQKSIKHKQKVAKHATGGRSPKYYDFNFTEDGSTVVMGDDSDLSMTPITKTLNCEVKGPGASFKVGDEDLEHVMGILTGVVTVYCKTDYPIWITQKGDDYLVGYLVAPKVGDEEVEVDVDEEGDVEVVEIEDEAEEEEDDDGEPEEDEPEDIPEETSDEESTEDEPVEEPTEEPEDESIEDENIPEEPKEEVQAEEDEDEEDLVNLDLDIS
jgi:hypothetical protein